MTTIEWTDETWNPLTGCAHASPGCDGCYAAREAAGRLSHHPAYQGLAIRRPGELPRFTGEIRLHPDRLDQPLRWRRPRRVFVNSMSDLFHPDVPAEFVGSVFSTMARADQHTFQVLTKRPQRMASILATWEANTNGSAYDGPSWRDRELRWNESQTWPLPNVWLGASIESDRYTWRANHLRDTPAAVRFLSIEPLLGPLPSLNLDGIDWVIVGGESGPAARPMHPEWVRDIRDRCVDAGVPFFFKQWGEWGPVGKTFSYWPGKAGQFVYHRNPTRSTFVEVDTLAEADKVLAVVSDNDAERMGRVGKKAAGRTLDGRTWNEYPDA